MEHMLTVLLWIAIASPGIIILLAAFAGEFMFGLGVLCGLVAAWTIFLLSVVYT